MNWRRCSTRRRMRSSTPEDYWLFLHLIVERLAHYRFLFQDLSNLAGRLPKLAKGIRNLLNGAQAHPGVAACALEGGRAVGQ